MRSAANSSLAHRLDEDLLLLSRQRNDPAGLVLAHQSLGRNSMFAGRFASSRSHLEEVIALCESNSGHSFVRQAGVHPQVASQAYLAIVLFCLGHPDQALARATAAIAEARRLAHAPSLAVSLTNGAQRLLSLVGDDEPSTSGPASWLRSRPSRVSSCGARWEQSIAGGSRSKMAMSPRAYRCLPQRFCGLPRHRSGGVRALSNRPPGQGM